MLQAFKAKPSAAAFWVPELPWASVMDAWMRQAHLVAVEEEVLASPGIGAQRPEQQVVVTVVPRSYLIGLLSSHQRLEIDRAREAADLSTLCGQIALQRFFSRGPSSRKLTSLQQGRMARVEAAANSKPGAALGAAVGHTRPVPLPTPGPVANAPKAPQRTFAPRRNFQNRSYLNPKPGV